MSRIVSPSTRNDRISGALLVLCAVGALGTAAAATTTAFDEHPDYSVMAVHDMLGFPVYAGLFLLLAAWPRRMPGIWELLIAQKATMGVLALTALRGDTDAAFIGGSDLVLAAILATAYSLARGWEAWRQP